jgi:2-aminoadipate transaminase
MCRVFAEGGDTRSLRLSFVTPSIDEINTGVAALAAAIRQELA